MQESIKFNQSVDFKLNSQPLDFHPICLIKKNLSQKYKNYQLAEFKVETY